MKQNREFIFSVIAFLILSALAITAVLLRLADTDGQTKPYESAPLSESTDSAEWIESVSLAAIKDKFDRHVHIHSDGKTVTVFDAEEAEEWAKRRESGEKFGLNETEIVWAIQDSVRLYRKYDRILLNPTHNERCYDTERTEISPYHGDFSEYEDAEARNQARENALTDLYTLILYRIDTMSAPEAFFTSNEAAEFCGYDDHLVQNPTFYYIPAYSDRTERLQILGAYCSFYDEIPEDADPVIVLNDVFYYAPEENPAEPARTFCGWTETRITALSRSREESLFPMPDHLPRGMTLPPEPDDDWVEG